jgi:hypothetical protein
VANVGLLFVGAVLFLNGIMLLGKVDARSAAVFNLFIGALQVLTPTYLIFTSGGDPHKILTASGLYLFGFTYLYVGIGLLMGLDTTGVGYYSLFVAVAALGYSYANFRLLHDYAFGAIWLYWSFLWFLFWLLLSGYWRPEHNQAIGIALGIFAVVVFTALWPVTKPPGSVTRGASRAGGTTAAGAH